MGKTLNPWTLFPARICSAFLVKTSLDGNVANDQKSHNRIETLSMMWSTEIAKFNWTFHNFICKHSMNVVTEPGREKRKRKKMREIELDSAHKLNARNLA